MCGDPLSLNVCGAAQYTLVIFCPDENTAIYIFSPSGQKSSYANGLKSNLLPPHTLYSFLTHGTKLRSTNYIKNA